MEEGRSSLCSFPKTRAAAARVMPHAFGEMALECESQVSGTAGLALAVARLSAGLLPARGSARLRTSPVENLGRLPGSRFLHRTNLGSIAESNAAYARSAACHRPNP